MIKRRLTTSLEMETAITEGKLVFAHVDLGTTHSSFHRVAKVDCDLAWIDDHWDGHRYCVPVKSLRIEYVAYDDQDAPGIMNQWIEPEDTWWRRIGHTQMKLGDGPMITWRNTW